MKKERKVNMILAIVLWLICIAMFLPMVFVIINSFKTFGQVVMEPLALPEEWNLDNFKEVMKTGNYLKVFGNTIYFAVVSGVIVIALGAMAGYKLDRMNNRIRGNHINCIYDCNDASVSGYYDTAGSRCIRASYFQQSDVGVGIECRIFMFTGGDYV